jgi:disulfide bond formation protein DsbB
VVANATDGSANASSRLEQLKIVGGLAALGFGLVALVVIVLVALLVKPDTTGGSIASGAVGVVGSIVGAYFGVKIGSDGTQAAIKAREQEGVRAHVSALHLPSEKADAVVAQTIAMLSAQQANRPS